jgi:hypothetical protein
MVLISSIMPLPIGKNRRKSLSDRARSYRPPIPSCFSTSAIQDRQTAGAGWCRVRACRTYVLQEEGRERRTSHTRSAERLPRGSSGRLRRVRSGPGRSRGSSGFELSTCTVEVDRPGRSEVYCVREAVWKAAGMAPFGGCLCIGCLEERLGRRVGVVLLCAVPGRRRRFGAD